MKIGGWNVPLVGGEWLMFQWGNDIPFDTQSLSLGYCTRGKMTAENLERMTAACGDIRSIDKTAGKNEFGVTVFEMLMYPTLFGKDFIIGKCTDSYADWIGRLCGHGSVVDERFCIVTNQVYPITFVSALFESGYVVLLDGCLENMSKFVNFQTFHVDQPDRVHMPLSARENVVCNSCNDYKCTCGFEMVISDYYSPSVIWNQAESQIGGDVEHYPIDMWMKYCNFAKLELNGLLKTTKVKTEFDSSYFCRSPLDIELNMQYEVFSCNSNYSRLVDEHMQRKLGRSLLTMSTAPSDVPTVLSDEPSDDDNTRSVELAASSSVFVTRKKGTAMEIITKRIDDTADLLDLDLELQLNLNTEQELGRNADETRPRCEICGTSFARKFEMKRHVSIVHLGEKRHTCAVCKRKFSLKQHLNVHVASVHEKRRDFPCNNCELAFATEAKLSRHIRCVHMKERTHVCSTCNAGYFQQSDLKRHIERKHSPEQLNHLTSIGQFPLNSSTIHY